MKKHYKELTEFNNEEANEMILNMTSFCRKICYDHDIRSASNPSWLSGKRMLTLSGLTNIQTRQLTHYNNINPLDCSCQNKHSNWIFHKAVECDNIKLENLDKRAKEIINTIKQSTDKRQAIKDILNDNFRQQTILRLLTQASFSDKITPKT